jgi:hypothetical protein
MCRLALSCALALAVVVPSLTPSPADAAARTRVTVAPAGPPGGFPAAPGLFGPLGEPGARFAGQCWKPGFGVTTYQGWWGECGTGTPATNAAPGGRRVRR